MCNQVYIAWYVRACVITCAAAGPRHLGVAAPRLRAVYPVVQILYMAFERYIMKGSAYNAKKQNMYARKGGL